MAHFKFEKDFRKENPQTVGETDAHFDLDNYRYWLEEKLNSANEALEETVFRVEHYSNGNMLTQEYFEDLLRTVKKAIITKD